jgi:hypothetical protein
VQANVHCAVAAVLRLEYQVYLSSDDPRFWLPRTVIGMKQIVFLNIPVYAGLPLPVSVSFERTARGSVYLGFERAIY